MSAKPDMSVQARDDKAYPLRKISFGDPSVSIERRADGTIYLRPKMALGEYPVRLTDRLHHWAGAAPDRIFMAERDAGGGWRQITYAELLAASRHIASSLLARGLSAEKPVIILSGNAIDHALVAFGALVCRHSVLPGVAGLFAGLKGLRQAFLSDEALDARARLRRRRRKIRRRA